MRAKSRPSRKAARCLLVHDGTPIMAAGLPALATFLRGRGHECEVRNFFSERRAGIPDDPGEAAAGFDILGLSIHWLYQIPAAMSIASAVKRESKKIFIVAGGFTASVFAEEIVSKCRDIDGVIVGDGEVPLLRLCAELSKGPTESLGRVPNLVARGKDGKARASNAPAYVGDRNILDGLEFADLSSVKNWHYYLHSSSWREITDGSESIPFDIDSTFYLCGGRGCSVQCMFCGGGKDSHARHSFRKGKFIFRSPARIADDVKKALGYGYRSFHTCFDPVPNGRHWFDFMKELRRRGIRTNFIFECFSLPSERFLRAVRESFEGAIVVLSPETSVEKIRKACKGFAYSNRELEACLAAAGALGLRAQVFFGYFLPGDCGETVEKNLQYIGGLESRFGSFASIHYYPYSTDPGSPVFLRPETFKMTCPLRSFEDYLEELSKEERLRGNLMRHFPAGRERHDWDLLSLRIELERACVRRLPALAGSIRAEMKARTGKFYADIARRLAEKHEISTIDRNLLHEYVRQVHAVKSRL
jgi:radical SAM superfamily enzyme YgiQ (UPF0313 family)